MDAVALPLEAVKAQLAADNIAHNIVLTRPSRNFFALAGETLYVVRQQNGPDGVLQLTVAAKMAGAGA